MYTCDPVSDQHFFYLYFLFFLFSFQLIILISKMQILCPFCELVQFLGTMSVQEYSLNNANSSK